VCLNPVVPVVRRPWASAVVDKVNLVDEWSAEFRVSYRAIWTPKARALDDTTTVAISGSVEESSQTESIIEAIGSRPAAFQFKTVTANEKTSLTYFVTSNTLAADTNSGT
jgi:hypothetical protein